MLNYANKCTYYLKYYAVFNTNIPPKKVIMKHAAHHFLLFFSCFSVIFGKCTKLNVTILLHSHVLAQKEVCTKPHEIFNSCGSACPPTCQSIHEEPKMCSMECVFGCSCDTEFVRDESSGDCVEPENCLT